MKKRILSILLALTLMLGTAETIAAAEPDPAISTSQQESGRAEEAKIIFKNYPEAKEGPIYIQGKADRIYMVNGSAEYEDRSRGIISSYCWEILNGGQYEEVLSGAGAMIFGDVLRKDTFLRLTVTGTDGSARSIEFAVMVTEIPITPPPVEPPVPGPGPGEEPKPDPTVDPEPEQQKEEEPIVSPKEVKLSASTFTYTGKNICPSVKVITTAGTVLDSSNYSVVYPSSSKNVGKYTVTVKFKGDYTGSLKASYQINPKGTSISSLKAGSRRYTVKWSKKTTQTTGYQIQYAENASFTGAKSVTVSSYKTTSKTVTKLKAKKKYYVRIRTYKTVSGVKYYSGWSSSRSVTTKR